MNVDQVMEKKAKKVKQLRDQCFIIANICEKIEKLTVMSEDPRMASGNKGQEILHQGILGMVEMFLG
jgi:hypothetical protein